MRATVWQSGHNQWAVRWADGRNGACWDGFDSAYEALRVARSLFPTLRAADKTRRVLAREMARTMGDAVEAFRH